MNSDFRTHTCGELTKFHLNTEVALAGWVHRRRDLGHLIFIDLRDKYGLTQLVFNPDQDAQLHTMAESLRSEYVVMIRGKVIERETANPHLTTGEIEISVTHLDILSKANVPPFSITDDLEIQESNRLKYRYLDLRRGTVLQNLQMRHKAMLSIRNFLDEQKFTEVTTPILGKSTPEGARDYLVPSRVYPGTFYALPQSPQIFKQLLMVGGMDRYFQFATCFRDEDLRADRQPEFMQIDIEMSFGKREDIIALSEGICHTVFDTGDKPFPVMSHAEAMERYGTDRPDLRFGMPLIRIDPVAHASDFAIFKNAPCVKSLCVNSSLSRKEIDKYTAFVGELGLKGLAWMKCDPEGLVSNIAKFFTPEQLTKIQELTGAKDGDTLLFAAAEEPLVNQAFDHLRRKIGADMELIDKKALCFTWVVDFPLFAWDEDEKRIVSEHHPFTAPHPEDLDLMKTDPLKVRSLAYDLVLNGYEIAGGSQRIHDSQLQNHVFDLLKLSREDIEEKFGFFVEALSYGTPPHLGIAFGFDRVMMIVCQTNNIRDVIAFPKTIKAADLMTSAPASVQPGQLKDLKIKHEK